MKYRLISTLILIPIIIILLFLASPIEFSIASLIICMLALWEWSKFGYFISFFERICLVTFYALLLIIIQYSLLNFHRNIHESIIVDFILWISIVWWFIALLLVLFYPKSLEIWKYSRILHIVSGLLIIVPFFCGILILYFSNYRENYYNSNMWLLYIIVLICSSDSSAYIFGKLFGKHKLAPKISPEKTWQGFISGLAMALIIPWIYSVWININITLSTLIICSVIAELTSVIGDLTESMFKRELGIKDSGHLIPGHGGILDRIDSLTAAVPVFTFLLTLIFKII